MLSSVVPIWRLAAGGKKRIAGTLLAGRSLHSAQTAHRLGYTAAADAIRDESFPFLAVCPLLPIFSLTTAPVCFRKN